MAEAQAVVPKITLDKHVNTLYMYLMKRNENMKDEQWEAHVDDNGCVYVTDAAGNTICDLYYVTGRVNRETGKKVLHTFPNAEEFVHQIAALPELVRIALEALEPYNDQASTVFAKGYLKEVLVKFGGVE